jgi:hypothetical protein
MLRFLKESTQVEMFIVYVGLRVEDTFGLVYKTDYFHVLVNANDSKVR